MNTYSILLKTRHTERMNSLIMENKYHVIDDLTAKLVEGKLLSEIYAEQLTINEDMELNTAQTQFKTYLDNVLKTIYE